MVNGKRYTPMARAKEMAELDQWPEWVCGLVTIIQGLLPDLWCLNPPKANIRTGTSPNVVQANKQTIELN